MEIELHGTYMASLGGPEVVFTIERGIDMDRAELLIHNNRLKPIKIGAASMKALGFKKSWDGSYVSPCETIAIYPSKDITNNVLIYSDHLSHWNDIEGLRVDYIHQVQTLYRALGKGILKF